MFNSGIIDVALGLIFIYLLLSLVCSAINEMIEARLKMRAKDLERGLRELLNDREGKGLVKDLYSHPLVLGLYPGKYGDAHSTTARLPRIGTNLPSYIPRRNFSLALMDVIMPAGDSTACPSGAAGCTVRAPDGGAHAAGPSMVKLRESVALIQNEHVRAALLVLVDSAGSDVSKARENIEHWFDSSMDRVSGWYKRRAQWIILALGLAAAAIMNADTITIATSLSSDVAVRDSLVATAQEYAKIGGAAGDAAPNPASLIEVCKKDENAPECRVEKNLQRIRNLGLPVGWNPEDERTMPRGLVGWTMKIIGWLLTAMAVSLGAPFWFDMLNKVIVVRATVKPTEKSPDEPPVDRR